MKYRARHRPAAQNPLGRSGQASIAHCNSLGNAPRQLSHNCPRPPQAHMPVLFHPEPDPTPSDAEIFILDINGQINWLASEALSTELFESTEGSIHYIPIWPAAQVNQALPHDREQKTYERQRQTFESL